MILLAIVCALVGWAFALAVVILGIRERQADAAAHERALAQRDAHISGLLAQVQANSQGYAHVPTYNGPASPEPERHVLTDDTGLIEVELSPAEWAERVAEIEAELEAGV